MRLLALCFGLCFLLAAQTQVLGPLAGPHLSFERSDASPAWPLDEASAAKITRTAVLTLLMHTGLDELSAIKSDEDLYEYRFVELQPGRLFLVAVVNSGGNVNFHTLAAIRCDGRDCMLDAVEFSPPIEFSKCLISIGGNGVYQILAEDTIGPRNDSPISSFSIYEMSGDGFRDASAKYRDWYKEHLYPKLVAQKEEVEHPREVNVVRTAYYTAAAQLALDEYRERVLGVKDASLTHALEWANSPYAEVHLIALRVISPNEESKIVDQVLDALEKSSSEQLRKRAIEIREQRRAERQRDK
jgi:hypothetical protein